MKKEEKIPKIKVNKKVPVKKRTRADEMDRDIVDAMSILDSMNNRMFTTEKTVADISKFLNVVSNTINYCLSSMYVYETYLTDLGADRNEIQKQIDTVYFEAYQKNLNGGDDAYKKSVLNKINQKISDFQIKLNEDK